MSACVYAFKKEIYALRKRKTSSLSSTVSVSCDYERASSDFSFFLLPTIKSILKRGRKKDCLRENQTKQKEKARKINKKKILSFPSIFCDLFPTHASSCDFLKYFLLCFYLFYFIFLLLWIYKKSEFYIFCI